MKVRVPPVRARVGGFRFAGVAAGLKSSGERDVALIVCDRSATVAAAFTQNRFQAAPVRIARERVRRPGIRAIVVNTVSANAGTGRKGLEAARRVCRAVARSLDVDEASVLPCSTGKIGVPLRADVVARGVRSAASSLAPGALADVADAIRTTDAFPKATVRRIRLGGRTVTVAGVAKGAGMIHPRMATTLVFLMTDARIRRSTLQGIWRRALDESFNAISVDGDTSTNDTALFLASGATGVTVQGGTPEARRLEAATREVLQELARWIVLDGEGASRIARVRVTGARNPVDADRAARAVANSPLVKTALAGRDPNWGRIGAAVGYSGARFDPERLEIRIGNVTVLRRGAAVGAVAERRAHRAMGKREVDVDVRLGAGRAKRTMFASDLTPAYVRFNSEYTS